MDMFNKLKSSLSGTVANTITNTVYNTGTIISGVLPGNPVTREYEVTAHIASAGPCLLWKVYSGVKKSTRQPASVFVLERTSLDSLERQDRDLVWDQMKKGVGQLTRLRHPQILTVQHPLEESRDCLAFATEPVMASLANVLGNHDNLPSPTPTDLRGFEMFDIEKKYGLLQLSEGLGFLHGSAKIIHRNLSPESILINQQGAWKIAGLEYCLSNTGPPGQNPSWQFPDHDHSLPRESCPQLDYTAPEYVLLGDVTPAADMFSYGMLALAVYTKRPLYTSNRNWGTFKKHAKDLRSLPQEKIANVPTDLIEYLKLLLNSSPDLRPTSEQVQRLPFFEDFGVKTLQNLDSQFQWDNLQKSQFYKGLPNILPRLPPRVALHRVFPCLAKEFNNPDMVPFVLPSSLQIAQDASKDDYVEHILPSLKPVMKIMEPIQILLIFMQKMELLLEKTPAEDVKSDVLPMVYQALESNVSQIQELCLSILPTFAGLLDRQTLKSSLLPRVRKVCISTSLLSVRVNSIICVGKLLDYMDKWQVIDDVLPMLPQIPSKEPAVIMGIVGIYKLAFTNSKLGLTKEVMASKVLPFLIPLSLENGLSVAQFNSVISLVKEMTSRVESEQRTKLEQLESLEENKQKSLNGAMADIPGQLVAAPSTKETNNMDSMFTGLGLGNYVSQDQNQLVKQVIQPVNNNNNKVSGSKSGEQGLSLQEKQRILSEQEAARKQASVQPSDLINNKSLPMNQISTMGTTTNILPRASLPSTSPIPSLTTPSNMHNRPAQQVSKADLSAFDSLFTSSQPQSKLPLNNLNKGSISGPFPNQSSGSLLTPMSGSLLTPTGSSPTSLPSYNGTKAATKLLSAADINDLLS